MPCGLVYYDINHPKEYSTITRKRPLGAVSKPSPVDNQRE